MLGGFFTYPRHAGERHHVFFKHDSAQVIGPVNGKNGQGRAGAHF